MTLVYLAVAWTLGIAVASALSLPMTVWAWWLVVPLGLFAIWWRDPSLRRAHLCLLVFLLSAIRYNAALPQFDDRSLATYNDHGTMLLVGNVIDPPEVLDRNAATKRLMNPNLLQILQSGFLRVSSDVADSGTFTVRLGCRLHSGRSSSRLSVGPEPITKIPDSSQKVRRLTCLRD